MWTSFKRILTSGAQNFFRSGAVSFATVLTMTVTLIIVGTLVFLSALLGSTLASIQDKVDVNVYFVTTAQERDIIALQKTLEARPDVKAVTYTSRDEALATFRDRHQDDKLTLQALDELGENPLGASLAIKATAPSQYEGIVNFLSDNPDLTVGGASIVDHVNYFQNKTVIDRLTSAIHTTQRAGLAIVILFAIASTIIALASMRLAIYAARDEIAVMRLVGASNAYIRGPFVVAGMLSGIIAALISLAIFYPVTWYAGHTLSSWLGGFNLFTYYLAHFPMVGGIILATGMLLGGIASWLGVRRYLRL